MLLSLHFTDKIYSELVSNSCFFPLSEGGFIGGQEEIISDFKNSIAKLIESS